MTIAMPMDQNNRSYACRGLRTVASALFLLCGFCLSADAQAAAQTQIASIPPAGIRQALIVCIDDYSKREEIDNAPAGIEAFDHLGNEPGDRKSGPCLFADQVEADLRAVWKDEEVLPVLRNPTYGDFGAAVLGLVGRVDTGNGSKPGIGLIYISAHAVSVGHTPFVVMPGQMLDINKARQTLRETKQIGPLFETSALNLDSFFFQRITKDCRCEVLVILDGCREDAFGPSADLASDTNNKLPSFLVGRPSGAGMLFGTGDGRTVSVNQLTTVVEALNKTLAAGVPMQRLFETVVANAGAIGRSRNYDPDFTPEIHYISRPENRDLWFAEHSRAAPPPANPSPTHFQPPSRPSIESRLVQRTLFAPQQGVPASPARVQGSSKVIYDPVDLSDPEAAVRAASEGSVSIDAYWCEGDYGAGARYAAAAEFADKAADLARSRTKLPRGLALGRIRLGPLSEAENSEDGFRLRDNQIRAALSDNASAMWSQDLVKRFPAYGLRQASTVLNSPGTIDVYFCSGAMPAGPAKPSIWLHAARQDQAPLADAAARVLGSEFPAIGVQGAVRIVKNSPAATQIRYFHKEDEPLAQAIAKSLGTVFTGKPIPSPTLPAAGQDVPFGHFELWIGQVGPMSVTLGCRVAGAGTSGAGKSCTRTHSFEAQPGFTLVRDSLATRVQNRNGRGDCSVAWNSDGPNPTRLTVKVSVKAESKLFGAGAWRTCDFSVDQRAVSKSPRDGALAFDPTIQSQPPTGVKEVDGYWRAPNGSPLYTFARDTSSAKSACVGTCATTWLALFAPPDAKGGGDWSVLTRDDGSKQWAYKGKPLYTFTRDTAGAPTGVSTSWPLAKK